MSGGLKAMAQPAASAGASPNPHARVSSRVSRATSAASSRRKKENGQAHGVEREDLAVAAAHAVVRREVAGMEDAIPAFGIVALQGHVVVADQAVGHHQVVRLVALGANLGLR